MGRLSIEPMFSAVGSTRARRGDGCRSAAGRTAGQAIGHRNPPKRLDLCSSAVAIPILRGEENSKEADGLRRPKGTRAAEIASQDDLKSVTGFPLDVGSDRTAELRL